MVLLPAHPGPTLLSQSVNLFFVYIFGDTYLYSISNQLSLLHSKTVPETKILHDLSLTAFFYWFIAPVSAVTDLVTDLAHLNTLSTPTLVLVRAATLSHCISEGTEGKSECENHIIFTNDTTAIGNNKNHSQFFYTPWQYAVCERLKPENPKVILRHLYSSVITRRNCILTLDLTQFLTTASRAHLT